jgi:ATP-binding protein involved in chromosome partitioning
MNNQEQCTHAGDSQCDTQHKSEDDVLNERMRDISKKLLILSGKGGVGKSTIAANLAIALANAGNKVGLLDADVHGPSIPRLLGLEGQRLTMNEQLLQPLQVTDNLKVLSVAFLLQSNKDPVIWRGPMKYNAIKQFLKDVEWGKLDYLVVDSPPGTGDEPLAVTQLVGESAAAVIVTTPQDLSISDVRRCISFCEQVDLPMVGIIENMSGLVCPHCKETIDLFKSGGAKALAEEMNIPLLGSIPIDPQVVISGDCGEPFVQQYSDNAAAQAMAGIIDRVIAPEKKQEEQPIQPTNINRENEIMKIAIPVANGCLCMHFGHCEQFALTSVDEATKKVLETTMLTPPPHEPGVLPSWLHEQGATVIIAGGMGQRAQQMFTQNGISVVVGAPGDAPESIVSAYLEGTLQTGQNVCDH